MKTKIISTLFFCLCSIMTVYAREQKQVRIDMTGDIMMGTTYPDSIQGIHLPKKNGRHLFDHVTSIIKDADAAFGNLESNFLNSGGKLKDKNNKDAFFIFRTFFISLKYGMKFSTIKFPHHAYHKLIYSVCKI